MKTTEIIKTLGISQTSFRMMIRKIRSDAYVGAYFPAQARGNVCEHTYNEVQLRIIGLYAMQIANGCQIAKMNLAERADIFDKFGISFEGILKIDNVFKGAS